MDRWDSRGTRPENRAEEREPYRGIFLEPPYSIAQATAGLIVIGFCRLLYLWIRGE